MKTETQKFKDKVERYITASYMGSTEFGFASVGSGAFITRLRDGTSPTLTTVDRVLQYMQDNPARLRRPR